MASSPTTISLWTLLVILLFVAVDFVCPLTSSPSSTVPTTVTTSITTTTPISTTTPTPLILNKTFTFNYVKKSNHSDPNSLKTKNENKEEDLAEAESSSYALEEDEDDDNDFDSQSDGFDDTDNNNNFESNRNQQVHFDTLNDLLTRSALSPGVAPSTDDHYQILNNRSASLKDFYEALSAQDADLDSDSGSSSSASSLTSSNDQGGDDDEGSDDSENISQNTIRLPSITSIINSNGEQKDLENRQDFLLPGSSGQLSPTSANFNYHRQQQLALYNQLSQMVQNSIASARGAGIGNLKTKGNSYVASSSAGKKSSAATTSSAAGGGKSKKLQIVYIKVNLVKIITF